jgi:hypothetical protein
MLTIFCLPLDFPVVQSLAKRVHFDARYFCSKIPRHRKIQEKRPSDTAEN